VRAWVARAYTSPAARACAIGWRRCLGKMASVRGEDDRPGDQVADLHRGDSEDVKNLIAVMRGKGLSASRVREAHLVVAAIFNEAVRDKMIAVSPCLAIALPEVTVNRDFIAPAAVQMDALAAGLPGGWAAAVWLMHGCGLRVGEALAVSERCITAEGTVLRVFEQVNPQGQPRPLKFRTAGTTATPRCRSTSTTRSASTWPTTAPPTTGTCSAAAGRSSSCAAPTRTTSAAQPARPGCQRSSSRTRCGTTSPPPRKWAELHLMVCHERGRR
jgi:hypothetical protein